MYIIKGPYSAPRPETFTQLKVRTVHLARQHLKNCRSVQCT